MLTVGQFDSAELIVRLFDVFDTKAEYMKASLESLCNVELVSLRKCMSCEIMKGTYNENSSEFFSVIDCPTLYATSTKMSSLLYIFFCGNVLEQACSCSESDNKIKHNEFVAIRHQPKALFIKLRRGLSETLVILMIFQ